ncbi:unnamed protein product [Ambrosiozyma monospora]|uniref:Unnamed protein product n=1 Tax=Ambrosiozyma monospora TaxID=43982 RepID=A0ACB5U870_AMBMO|nr:unnamed protein product [Ambrosiozyma monospora]
MNRNRILVSLIKIIVSILHIPLIFSLNNTETSRTRLAIAISTLHLIVAICLFLCPTLLNLWRCGKQYWLYKNGRGVGIEVPDYRRKGEFIELPMDAAHNQSSGSSLRSFGSWSPFPFPFGPFGGSGSRDSGYGRGDVSLNGSLGQGSGPGVPDDRGSLTYSDVFSFSQTNRIQLSRSSSSSGASSMANSAAGLHSEVSSSRDIQLTDQRVLPGVSVLDYERS